MDAPSTFANVLGAFARQAYSDPAIARQGKAFGLIYDLAANTPPAISGTLPKIVSPQQPATPPGVTPGG